MTTFVDSSAWYAAADRGDVDHERITGVLADAEALVTSDHVLVETWFLLDRRLSQNAAETFLAEAVRGGLTLAWSPSSGPTSSAPSTSAAPTPTSPSRWWTARPSR